MKNEISPAEMKQKIAAKQEKLASIVGEAEAKRLMERALKMVAAGQKSISDIL